MGWEWDAGTNDYYWKEEEKKGPKAASPYEQLAMIVAAQGALAGGQSLGAGLFGGAEGGGLLGGLFGGKETIAAGSELLPGASGSIAGSQAGGAATSGIGSSLGSLAGLAPYAGVAAGGALLAKGASDMINNEETKGLGGWGGRATLGIATGGLSELAKAAGLFDHKSTRDVAKDHTSDLLGRFQDDQGYQSYVSGMREQFNQGPTDPSRPFAGKYGTWDEYKSAGLDAKDLSGVYGNINTFGQDWTKIDQKKREEITKALIDANLYQSKKGEVEITDPERAKKIYSELAGIVGS